MKKRVCFLEYSLFGVLLIVFFSAWPVFAADNKQKMTLLNTTQIEIDSLNSVIPQSDIPKVTRTINSAFMRSWAGGNSSVSFSENGRYKALKTQYDTESSDEMKLQQTVIGDEDDNIVWQGETLPHIAISNNGKNFVSTNFPYGWAVNFYHYSSSQPVNSYSNLNIGNMAFSDDGNYFIMWSESVLYFCTADGDILWKKYLVSPVFGEAAIAPDGANVLYSYKTRETPITFREPTKEQKKKYEQAQLVDRIKRIQKEDSLEAYQAIRQYQRLGKLPKGKPWKVLNKLALEFEKKKAKPARRFPPGKSMGKSVHRSGKPFTLITREGVSEEHTYDGGGTVERMAFSGAGDLFTIGCGPSIFVFDTKNRKQLWNFKMENSYYRCFDTKYSNDDQLICAFFLLMGAHNRTDRRMSIVLLDRNGVLQDKMDWEGYEESTISFSNDNKYLVAHTGMPNNFRLFKIEKNE